MLEVQIIMQFEKNEKNIKSDIANSITRSVNAAFLKSRFGNPQEPDFVAELVNGLPQDIYNSLKTYAPHYQYAVSGIFCHQKPLANYGGAKNPELGDILLVYIEENKYSVKKCNALLLQAKKVNKVPYNVSYGESHQLKLYEEWPKFTLERAGVLNGTEIDVQPKTLNAGAQYLLFQSACKDEKRVCCAYPDKELFLEKKLSEQIIDLMKFFTGRTFLYEENSACNDDWTKLIWDLIRISGVSTYNRRAIRRVNESRINTYGDIYIFDKMNRKIDISEDAFNEEAVSCLIIYAKETNKEIHQYEQLSWE